MPEPLDQVVEEHVPALSAPTSGRLTPTPYNFEFTGTDYLRLTVHNSQAGAVVAVHYRVQRPDGEVTANRQFMTPATDRSATTLEFGIGKGFLLNVSVFASSGQPKIGQTFASLRVIRGLGASSTVLGTVVQGYVTSTQDLGWPGSPLSDSISGGGVHRTIVGTDPGATTEFAETVPTGARWEVLTVYNGLTTSAVAGTRTPRLILDDGSVEIARIANPLTIAQSDTNLFQWQAGATPDGTSDPDIGIAVLPSPTILLAGHRLRSSTGNMQAGDNWSAPVLTVREWLEAQ
jgi:hypothetical protein